MPVGIQRLNAKRSQPNPNIVFIKPLSGPHENIAQKFLERIAAQCLPVMRKNHISVMTLEEYEPNREFVGRNFNAGEVVQLVLRSPRTGRWLPFKYVQMVMMHELAHCKQMNHSRAFWAVRNQYAAQMYELWGEGYTGDGIWGRGANLATGEWEGNTVQSDEVLPEHLCGGTYRSRRRKRSAKPRLTYQERKQRRILKKFGENGVALGADEEAKVKLEKGKKVKAKPRVAGSARGRELRAAAALARFEQQKVDVEDDDESIKDVEDETDSGSASGGEYEESPLDAVDADGTRLVDGKGRGMVKVCEDEDAYADDPDARNELTQLQDMFKGHVKREVPHGGPTLQHGVRIKDEPTEGYDKPTTSIRVKREPDEDLPQVHAPPQRWKPVSVKEEDKPTSNSALMERTVMPPWTSTCSVCSFKNDTVAATCSMCANVLNPAMTPDIWRCAHSSCKNSEYVNSGDCGLCGVCGQRRDV